MRWTLLSFSAIALVICVLMVIFLPNPVFIKPFTSADAIRILASLLFVSLLLERAIEIVITPWREPDKAKLVMTLENLKERLENQSVKSSKAAQNWTVQMEKIQERKIEYMAKTQRIAMGTALVAGWMVSAIGFRSLEFLVEPGCLSVLPRHQTILLKCTDVLLTGGILAGGSEGIHRIMNLYSNFMDSAAGKIKNNMPGTDR